MKGRKIMEYWFFTEAAYPELPPESTYESVRVKLPSRLLDPEVAANWWDEYLAEWQAAAELGFNLMVNEHHGTATCMNATVPLTAAILTRITGQGRILILGNPIANRRDPVRVAEEMAMLDVLSRGRLEVGFVRGVPYEISATNSKPVGMSERMWEAHDLIKLAWTSHDGPVNWQGKHFEHRQINIWPRPYQQPHPPIWVTTLSQSGARPVGERGYVVGTFLTGIENTRKVFEGYREGWSRTRDGEVPSDRLAYAGLVYVGESDEEGMAGAEKLTWYITSNKSSPQFMDPPGYRPVEARMAAVRGMLPTGLKGLSLEQLIDRGVLFAGSAETVAAQIRRFCDEVGEFGHFLVMGQSGHMHKDETIASLTRLAHEVRPLLKEQLPLGRAL
jgi:alkanesulfonate monooxygenase SsuD/methylene tetrahydromethanopterin reductase-like flavin-dependent oxidoreductase (luciferase family)